MIPLACGACGISVLSSVLPPFGYWMYLLPVAFIAYLFVLYRDGQLTFGKILSLLGLAVVAFLASAMMLAGIIIPIVFLTVFIKFLMKIPSSDRLTRGVALLVLGLYAGTGIYAFSQSKNQGPYWQLTRIKAGGPGMNYYSKTAENDVFSRDELLKYLQSEEIAVRRNVRGVIVQKARFETDPAEAEAFYLSLSAIDSELAKEYQSELKISLGEADEESADRESSTTKPLTIPEK